MDHLQKLILENKIKYKESNGQIYLSIKGYDVGFKISKTLVTGDKFIYNIYRFIQSEFEFFKQNIKINRRYGNHLKIYKHEKGYFYIYAIINGHNITMSFNLDKDTFPRNLQTSIGITIQLENKDYHSFELTIGETLPKDHITSFSKQYAFLQSYCIENISLKTY